MFRACSHSSGQIAYSSSCLIWTLDDVCAPLGYHWYFVVFLSVSFPSYLLNFKLMLSCWFLFIIHIDTVEIGGSGNVWLGRNDYVYVKAASKPSGMALHLPDKLFPKATLMRSTIHRTKDFTPLNSTIISAMKGQWSILIHMHITCDILFFLVCFSVIHLHFPVPFYLLQNQMSNHSIGFLFKSNVLHYSLIYRVNCPATRQKNILKGNGSG